MRLGLVGMQNPLLKRPFQRSQKVQCLRCFSLSANDFADASLSKVFTRHHALSLLYRYKKPVQGSFWESDQLAARNEITGTGTVAWPGLSFFICRSISRTVTAEK